MTVTITYFDGRKAEKIENVIKFKGSLSNDYVLTIRGGEEKRIPRKGIDKIHTS